MSATTPDDDPRFSPWCHADDVIVSKDSLARLVKAAEEVITYGISDIEDRVRRECMTRLREAYVPFRKGSGR
jgi:hypothetical protein